MNKKILITYSLLFFSSSLSAMKNNASQDKPERKNYSKVQKFIDNTYPLIEKISQERKKIEELKRALRDQREEDLWLANKIDCISKQTSDNSPYAFLLKKESINNAPYAERLALLGDFNNNEDNIRCFRMLFKKIFKIKSNQNKETAIEKKNYIEFILKSIIDYDLMPAWESILSAKGLEFLSKHLRYVDHALHNKDNSLIDFLDSKYPSTCTGKCKTTNGWAFGLEASVRKFFIEACAQTFDVDISYGYGLEKLSHPIFWRYSFSFDRSDSNLNSFATILKNLISDPENFRDGQAPHDFSSTLETLLNKEKHYFSFLANLETWSSDGINKNSYLVLFSKILLNEQDPDLQKTSYQERQRIILDVLQKCINHSGKQDLTGKQEPRHRGCNFPGESKPCSKDNCICKKIDFSVAPEALTYQFLLSLSPHHKTADDLLGWLYCAKELRENFVEANKHIFFHFLTENVNDVKDFDFYQDNIASFIKKHPELFEENTPSEGENSKTQSIDSIAFLFENALNYLSDDDFYKLGSLYMEKRIEINAKIAQLEKEDEEGEQTEASKKLSPSIEDLSHQTQ